jgi:hypothetical protein
MDKQYLEEMNDLKHKLDRIEHLLIENKQNCDKMSNHIDFIERVYEYIKKPLFYITNKFKIMSKEEPVLELESMNQSL